MGLVIEKKMSALHFVHMYGTRDASLAGSKGGSSLCYMTVYPGQRRELESLLTSKSDLVNVRTVEVETAIRQGLAYQQTRMLSDAYALLEKISGE